MEFSGINVHLNAHQVILSITQLRMKQSNVPSLMNPVQIINAHAFI